MCLTHEGTRKHSMARRHINLGPELDAQLRDLAAKFSLNTSKLLRRGAELAIAEYTAMLQPATAVEVQVAAPVAALTLAPAPAAAAPEPVPAMQLAFIARRGDSPVIAAWSDVLSTGGLDPRNDPEPPFAPPIPREPDGLFELRSLCALLSVAPVDAIDDMSGPTEIRYGTPFITLDGLNEVCALAHDFNLADKVKAWALAI